MTPGMLVEGEWKTEEGIPRDSEGRFVRSTTAFRDWVTADGSSGFAAEAGRYHLYVAWACPWAHRTIILRKLKGLEGAISMSVVGSYMGDEGWGWYGESGEIPDDVNGARFLREVYQKADPGYTGRVTTPALWDKETGTMSTTSRARSSACSTMSSTLWRRFGPTSTSARRTYGRRWTGRWTSCMSR